MRNAGTFHAEIVKAEMRDYGIVCLFSTEPILLLPLHFPPPFPLPATLKFRNPSHSFYLLKPFIEEWEPRVPVLSLCLH